MGELMAGILALAAIEGLYLAYVGYPLFLIGQAFDLNHRWMAFVPVLGYFVLTSAGQTTHWSLALLLIPLVNIIVLPYLWARVCDESGQSEARGWLTLVPILNIIMHWVISTSAVRTMAPRPQPSQ